MSKVSGILITQCLQNDFVQLIEKHDPLPNLLHVGYSESLRLSGERAEEGPINSVMEWAYSTPENLLAIIHIRDWHNADDPAQKDHLKQFGSHCLKDSRGADFVFKSIIKSDRKHEIVNASGLNDFVGTGLEKLLAKYESARVGIAGVWTEAKVFFLAYELKTRFPNFDIALCSALTASSSRAMHFIALDHIRNILGIEVFSSIGAFTNFLTGETPKIRRAAAAPSEANFHIESENPISDTDRSLIQYLFRDCREARFKCLDGGFSGNVVLRAKSRDKLGHLQVPTVVKIGPRDLIAEERTSFERIQEVMGNNAPTIVNFAELEDRGAIIYRYAAMLDGEVHTFQSVYMNSSAAVDSAEADSGIFSILDTVFQKQLNRLYEASNQEKLDLLKYYDFRQKYAASVKRNLAALIKESDSRLLKESAAIALAFYEKDLLDLKEYSAASHFMAYVHGDLNGRNIIIDAQRNVWLIDFFHTSQGHILRDLIKLENDILYIFTVIRSEEELNEAFRLSDILVHTPDLGSPPDSSLENEFQNPLLRKAFRTICRLRSYYPALIESDRDPYQLQVGLLRYAMHTLSFDESNEWQRKWALYTGRLCIEEIKKYLEKSKTLRIDYLSVPGSADPESIGITILPGRKDRGRDLEQDVRTLCVAGITHIVCLITESEFIEYGVQNLKKVYESSGLKVKYFPILDQGVPIAESLYEVLDWMDETLNQKERLLVHCVGGLGRSGLVAAGYLIRKRDCSAEKAIALVRQCRTDRAVETRQQEEFLYKIARREI